MNIKKIRKDVVQNVQLEKKQLKYSIARSIIFFLFIFFSSAVLVAQENLRVKVAFDPAEAEALLAPGTGTIKGIAYTRTKNGFGITGSKTTIVNETVYLFPFTRHLAEWYKQNSKVFKNKNKQYILSDECLKYNLHTTTDAYGSFEFKNLKPGKYLLQTKYYRSSKSWDRDYDEILMDKVVEIKSEHEVLDVKFANW